MIPSVCILAGISPFSMDQCLIQRNDFLIVEFLVFSTSWGMAGQMKSFPAFPLVLPHQQAPACEVSSMCMSKSGVSNLNTG